MLVELIDKLQMELRHYHMMDIVYDKHKVIHQIKTDDVVSGCANST
jgi:hypothetical protein